MNRILLFRNYLKLGMRNIQKNIVTSSINIFGLAIALGFVITTYIFVDMQLNMDRFHTKKDRIYQIFNYMDEKDHDRRWGDSPILLGPQLLADNPSIEKMARLEYRYASIKNKADVFEELVVFMDPAYLEIFDFPMIYGNQQALYDKNKVVISKDIAVKYFNDEDPIGKDLSMKFSNGKIIRLTVGAVLDEYPYNTSFKHGIHIPIDNFFDLELEENYDWSFLTDGTFVLLKEGESIQSLEDSYPQYIELQNASNPDWRIRKFEALPLRELSVTSWDTVSAISGGGHPAGRVALSIIGSFLLAMACFNFMNISVVSATKRLKEIALRKVMGGVRKQIIYQFLTENVLQCTFALLLGVLIAYFLLVPGFDYLVPQMEIEFRAYSAVSMAIFFLVLLLGTGIISGAYPAFYISKFEAITIFKGNQKFGAKNIFSKIMLSIQLILAVITIVGCFVLTDQNFYLDQKDWGYDPSGTVSVFLYEEDQYEKLKNEALKNPDLLTYSGSTYLIGRGVSRQQLEYEDKKMTIRKYGVYGDFYETFGLRLVSGRFLTDQQYDLENSVVVNETFVKEIGWDDPINKTFVLDSVRKTVVGVVQDFHYYDFFAPIDPVVFEGSTVSDLKYISFRARPEKVFEFENYTKESWQQIAPNDPFDREFQEDVFDDFYQENSSNTTIMMVITSFSIILACLGLYGLLSFNIQGKMKEFSVRKVLGASPKTIARIAGKQYSWVVLIAFIIGAPLGFLGMQTLIESVFPNPKNVSALPFIISIALITITMVITVSGQVSRAIKVNPADVLRNE